MTPSLDPEIRARIKEAKRPQARLRECVVAEDRLGPVRRVAGLDVHSAPDPEGRGTIIGGTGTARYAPGRKSSRWRAQVYLIQINGAFARTT